MARTDSHCQGSCCCCMPADAGLAGSSTAHSAKPRGRACIPARTPPGNTATARQPPTPRTTQHSTAQHSAKSTACVLLHAHKTQREDDGGGCARAAGHGARMRHACKSARRAEPACAGSKAGCACAPAARGCCGNNAGSSGGGGGGTAGRQRARHVSTRPISTNYKQPSHHKDAAESSSNRAAPRQQAHKAASLLQHRHTGLLKYSIHRTMCKVG